MRLRSFTAPTMREAMDQVREAMGADAIIVAAHRSERGRGVRLTAAMDHPEEERLLSAEVAVPAAGPGEATARALAWHGASETLLRELTGAASLVDALARRFSFAELDDGGRPLMLVGPPGAGKTTSVAKLAARAALAGAPAALVTTDTVRAGAVAQLEAFAAVLRQPLQSAESPDELRAAILTSRGPAHRRVLIDTPGANPFNKAEMADLRRFLRVCDVEPVLVLPAGGDAGDAAEIAAAFAACGCRKMIATRIDGARRFGSLLAAASAGLAFSEASFTPSVAQGLRPMSALALARLLGEDSQPRDAASAFGE